MGWRNAYRAQQAHSLAEGRRKLSCWRREFDFSHREALVGLVAKKAQVTRAEVFMIMCELRSAANKARPRGFISDWDFVEGAFACDMPEDTVTKIVDALYATGWLVQEAIVTWSVGQPEDEDATAAERQRRSRARKVEMRRIAQQACAGLITEEQRRAAEIALLPTRPGYSQGMGLSTGDVTRDTVTVTPDSDSDKKKEAFNSGDKGSPQPTIPAATSGNVDAAEEVDATVELQFHMKRIVIERLGVIATLADTRISRWLEQLSGNAAALVEIIRAADKADYVGARFHNLIVDQIKRYPSRIEPALPLPLAAVTKRQGSG